jgi:hypothetical protein
LSVILLASPLNLKAIQVEANQHFFQRINFRLFDQTNPQASPPFIDENKVVLYHKQQPVWLANTKIFVAGEPLVLYEKKSFNRPFRGLVLRSKFSGLRSPVKQQSISRLDGLIRHVKPKAKEFLLSLAHFLELLHGDLDFLSEQRLDIDK